MVDIDFPQTTLQLVLRVLLTMSVYTSGMWNIVWGKQGKQSVCCKQQGLLLSMINQCCLNKFLHEAG